MKTLLATLLASSLAFTGVGAEEKKKEKKGKTTVTGSVLCAKCDLKAKTSCQNAVKTADGKTYLLAGKKAEKFFKENKGTKKVTATGTTSADGKHTALKVSKIAKAEEKKDKKKDT